MTCRLCRSRSSSRGQSSSSSPSKSCLCFVHNRWRRRSSWTGLAQVHNLGRSWTSSTGSLRHASSQPSADWMASRMFDFPALFLPNKTTIERGSKLAWMPLNWLNQRRRISTRLRLRSQLDAGQRENSQDVEESHDGSSPQLVAVPAPTEAFSTASERALAVTAVRPRKHLASVRKGS